MLIACWLKADLLFPICTFSHESIGPHPHDSVNQLTGYSKQRFTPTFRLDLSSDSSLPPLPSLELFFTPLIRLSERITKAQCNHKLHLQLFRRSHFNPHLSSHSVTSRGISPYRRYTRSRLYKHHSLRFLLVASREIFGSSPSSSTSSCSTLRIGIHSLPPTSSFHHFLFSIHIAPSRYYSCDHRNLVRFVDAQCHFESLRHKFGNGRRWSGVEG